MNLDDWKLAAVNERNYQRALEEFAREYVPLRLRSAKQSVFFLPAEIENEISLTAEVIARRMIAAVAAANARSWRAAARQSLHGQKIFQALQAEASSAVLGLRLHALILHNASLIRSLPTEIAQMTSRFVAAEQRRGQRADTIAKLLQEKVPQLTQSRAALIARTEVGKAESAITQARSERLGLAWYDWATSKDQRVRPAHQHMESVLVAWADAPAPEQLAGERSTLGHYHAGSAPNCRCLALPLISLDEIKWPHRVYAHGVIEPVSRAQFEKWIRMPNVA